ncbi:CocE/NonD family hydrolase [Nocardia sp. NPDC052278]|uniref:CocE/NonD family hydrolase n=1 Tax=unclassified Nocardia TaxID=2637762 RepID=UPI00369389C6
MYEIAGRLGWRVMSRVAQKQMSLPKPLTRNIVVQRDLEISMPDGTVLLADFYRPGTHSGSLPTLLVRSPYGRRGMLGLYVRPFAERGYQVLVQSTRGTFGSGGEYEPLRHERADGLATIDWVIEQPWFDGNLVLAGPSYMGYAQWAVADKVPSQVKAILPVTTSANVIDAFHRPEGMLVENLLDWTAIRFAPNVWSQLLTETRIVRRIRKALAAGPVVDSEARLVGQSWPFFQEVMQHHSEDPHWSTIDVDHRETIAGTTVPVNIVAGWYDLFLPHSLRDYRTLVDAGRQPRLTVGPWTHIDSGLRGAGIREGIEWGLTLARGGEVAEQDPVRLFVTGSEQWRNFPSWPPPDRITDRWHLHPHAALDRDPAVPSAPDTYRYDPADPTPSLGMSKLVAQQAGPRDNRELESRADVLTFTSAPMTQNYEVIGDVTAEIWLRSSRPSTDLFVRICDVDPRGRSINVCDGISVVETPEPNTQEPAKVVGPVWPTAHCFRRGHRIRVQISSGAHPVYARNVGSIGERLTGTSLHVADQEIFHDPEHPSVILLPGPTAGS